MTSKSSPHGKKLYNTPQFSHEQWKVYKTFFNPKDTKIRIPNDLSGKWINIKDNLRMTSDIPKEFKKRIYVFGGSTIFCTEVPDSLTICSFLQRELNNHQFDYRVYNLGVHEQNSIQQFERLKRDITIKKDDLIIFYDGVNDIFNGVYLGNEYGSFEIIRHEFFFKIMELSSIIRYFYRRSISNYDFPNNRYKKTADNYLKTIKDTKKYVEQQNGIFLHFFQPNIYSKKNLSEFEKKIIMSAEKLFYPNLDKAFMNTIPIIKKVLFEYNFSTDLTGSLDTVNSTIYYDHCHINELGNKVISNNIFKKVKSVIEY